MAPTLKVPSPPSLMEDTAPPPRYFPNYPALQPNSQPIVTHQSGRVQLSYPDQPPADYYDNESQLTPNLPLDSGLPRPDSFLQEHPVGTGQCSDQFGDAIPHRHQQAGPEPGNGASRFETAVGYDVRPHAVASSGSYHDMMQRGSAFDVMLSNPLNRPAARRGPFKNNDDREKTAQTRKIGSCVRCRMQRIRVCFPLFQKPISKNTYTLCLGSNTSG